MAVVLVTMPIIKLFAFLAQSEAGAGSRAEPCRAESGFGMIFTTC